MEKMNRRDFVVNSACAMCACALPALLAENAAADSASPIDAGPLAQYSKPGANDSLAKSQKLFVINQDGELYAASSICTHKGCPLHVKDDNLVCHCHGSIFTIHGTVDHGPAKRSLIRYGVSLSGDKHVIIDKSKEFVEKDWDNPDSFIKL